MTTASKGRILTVGHSNIPFEAFADNLRRNGVSLVVDVRSHPWSRYAVQFNDRVIARSLRDGGVDYLYRGKELGGRPQSDAFYDEKKHVGEKRHVRYDLLAESPLFGEGRDLLERAAERHRVAVMCSEEDPVGCHRYRLIGRKLTELGYEVGHIRSDGRIERQDEVDQRDKKSKSKGEGAQLNLIPDQEQPWRSAQPIRSGSRSTQPRISSRR